MVAAKGARKKSGADDSETIILRLTIRKNASPAAHRYLSSLEKATRARHVLELLTQAQATAVMRDMLAELLEFQRSQREGLNNQVAQLSALQKVLTDFIAMRQDSFFVQPSPSNGHVISGKKPSTDKEREWSSVTGGLHNALDFDTNDGSFN